MLDPPQPTGAPPAGHHLVGDEQHVMAVADLANHLEVPGRGGCHAQRRADDRLGYECRHVLGALLTNGGLQRARA